MTASACTGCGSSQWAASKEGDGSKAKRRPTKFRTVCTFLKNGACSRTLMTVLDKQFDHPMRPEELATDPLAGGMMQGYQCGMLWGSTLAAGAQAYRQHGPGPEAEGAAMRAAQNLVEAFRARHQAVDCIDITETDPRKKWQLFVHFFVKGGTVRCAARMARFAPDAYRAINAAVSEEKARTGCNPESCAAVLAKKMGASDKHAAMAAGLAGGIGFSGSGCGALGAAIWILGMEGREEGLANKVIQSRINELMERFLKSSGYEYECSEIVGRKFKDIDDHAAYVRQRGCAKLIEAIAAAAEEVREGVPTPATEEAVQLDGQPAAA